MKTTVLSDREQAKKRAIVDRLLTDIEGFRAEAAGSLARFTRDERRQLAELEVDETTSYDVLLAWQDSLQPLREMLHGKRSDKTFRTQLTKHLALEDNEVQITVNQLVDRRRAEVLETCLDRLYSGTGDATERHYAKDLLLLPDTELSSLKAHFVDAVLHKEVASEYDVAIFDAHSSWWTRQAAKRHIKKQRRRTIASEKKRLKFIASRQKELRAMNDGIVGELLEKQWDLITVLALRNQYEKAISKLAKNLDTPVKRLAIFDRETRVFRDQQTVQLSTKTMSLETTRHAVLSIDNLLLRIFDLSNVQKNQLLILNKEYRELSEEKAAIELARQTRSRSSK